MLAATYLGVWLAFGVVCYAIYTAAGMPWPNQTLVVGLSLVLAGVYSVSPIKPLERAATARDREGNRRRADAQRRAVRRNT